MFMNKDLLILVLIINLIVFIVVGIDKYKAIKNLYRISEKNLLFLGFFAPLAFLIGMVCFKHKIRKVKFVLLIPLFAIFHLYLIYKFFA